MSAVSQKPVLIAHLSELLQSGSHPGVETLRKWGFYSGSTTELVCNWSAKSKDAVGPGDLTLTVNAIDKNGTRYKGTIWTSQIETSRMDKWNELQPGKGNWTLGKTSRMIEGGFLVKFVYYGNDEIAEILWKAMQTLGPMELREVAIASPPR